MSFQDAVQRLDERSDGCRAPTSDPILVESKANDEDSTAPSASATDNFVDPPFPPSQPPPVDSGTFKGLAEELRDRHNPQELATSQSIPSIQELPPSMPLPLHVPGEQFLQYPPENIPRLVIHRSLLGADEPHQYSGAYRQFPHVQREIEPMMSPNQPLPLQPPPTHQYIPTPPKPSPPPYNCEQPESRTYWFKSTEPPNAGPPLSVLIAEDNPINQKVLSKLLARHGHEAHIANNGQEAMDLLQRSNWWAGYVNPAERINVDVVLMDVEMPVMDGLEATRRIREWEAARLTRGRVPVISLVVNSLRQEWLEMRDAGAFDEWVSKPFRIQEVVTKSKEVANLWKPWVRVKPVMKSRL